MCYSGAHPGGPAVAGLQTKAEQATAAFFLRQDAHEGREKPPEPPTAECFSVLNTLHLCLTCTKQIKFRHTGKDFFSVRAFVSTTTQRISINSSRLDYAVALLICIREMPVSNLALDTDQHANICCDIPQTLQAKAGIVS